IQDQLSLTETQKKKLKKLTDDYEAAMKGLREQASAGKSIADLNRRAQALQSDLGRGFNGLLTPSQKERWKKMLGKSFDLSQLQPRAAMAPEFKDVSTWVNGPAVTLKELRGRVVVLHFYTFGCINCIHNFPSYKNYQDRFKNRDVTIVGIHTPE